MLQGICESPADGNLCGSAVFKRCIGMLAKSSAILTTAWIHGDASFDGATAEWTGVLWDIAEESPGLPKRSL